MTLRRMDNVLIVVDDLDATKAFFIQLGLGLESRAVFADLRASSSRLPSGAEIN